MSVTRTALVALEEALNRVIETDPVTRERFAELHGKRVAIEFSGWATLHFVPDAAGRLQLFAAPAEEADAVIAATPFDFVESALAEHQEDPVFTGKVQLRGDTALAQRFARTLSSFDFDWEEQLAKIFGDLVAHQIGLRLHWSMRWASRSAKHFGNALSDYLTEEKHLLPTAFEVNEWREQVEDVRDAVERLAARIALLDKKLGGSP